MLLRLLLVCCLMVPGVMLAQGSPLQLRLQQVLKEHLSSEIPVGSVVHVVKSFPLQSGTDDKGFSTPFSLELYDETLAALTALKVGVDTRPVPVGKTLDPCDQPDLTRFVLSGHYRLVGDDVRIQLRICNRDSKEAVSPLITLKRADITTAGLELLQPRPALAEAITRLDQTLAPPQAKSSSGLKVYLATERGDNVFYQVGETLQLKAGANRDCWFYVWHIDAKGDIQLLFPNYESRDNQLKANQVLILGRTGTQDGSVVVEPPLGLETLYLVAQEHAQFSDYQEIMNSLSSQQPTYKGGLTRSSTPAELQRAITKGLRLRVMSGGDVQVPSGARLESERLQPGQAVDLTQLTILPKL